MKEDLLNEFREERIMINKQVELLDPIATSFRKPAAQRLINSGILIVAEFGCYLLGAGCIAATVLMYNIYPFNILGQLLNNPANKGHFEALDLTTLTYAFYGIGALLGALLFIIGRMSRGMRQKNSILHMAGKDLKIIIEQSLVRKAAIDTIEQRHLLDLSGINLINNGPDNGQLNNRQTQRLSVHDVYNPGYGG